MTINLADNNPRITYTVAQGVTQSAFVVPFEFFSDADLNVYVDTVKKTLTTHYTTSDNSGNTQAHTSGTTGYIHFTSGNEVTGISGGSSVVITRDIPIERTTDFPASGPFDISSLNTGLDKIIAISADLKDAQDRTLTLEDFDTTTSITLPTTENRKGKYLRFNSTTGAPESGNAFVDNYTVSATTPSSPALGDLWFDTSTNTVFVYSSAGFVRVASNINGTQNRFNYTATAGQTTFAATYDVGFVDVYLNGIKLITGTDFTASNGTSIVLTVAAALNDTVNIIGYGTFTLLNTVLNDIGNVNVSSPADGTVIEYNSTSGNYEKSGVLSVRGTSGIIVSGGDSGVTETGQLFLEDNASCSMLLASPNTASGIINFADPEDTDVGQIKYDHSNNTMSFRTNGNDCLSITSAGRPTFDFGSSTGTNATFTTTGSGSNVDFVTSAGTTRLRTESSRLEIFGDVNSDGSGTTDSEIRLVPRGSTSAKFRVIGDGDIKADAGFGSTTSVYLPRAWIHYNHSTPNLVASGNVSSVADDGTGDLTVNFSTNFPDAAYVVMGTGGNQSGFNAGVLIPSNLTTSSVQIKIQNLSGSDVDLTNITIAFLR
tara:strand:- start:329 stop:2128 length:1800 start_codon:yes stop_codon:yes gene_type:complete